MTSSETAEPGAPEGDAVVSRVRGRGALLAIIAVALLVLIGRIVTSGSGALERGDAAHARGDHLGAAVAWREAVSWVLPLAAPWRVDAMDRLEALADEREAVGDLPGAVMALSSLRSGILAGHGLWRPDQERIASVDARLAPMMATWESRDALRTGRTVEGDRASRVAFYEAHLRREVRPSRVMSLLTILGFLAWLGGMYRAANVVGAPRVKAFIVAGTGLCAMLLGVALA